MKKKILTIAILAMAATNLFALSVNEAETAYDQATELNCLTIKNLSEKINLFDEIINDAPQEFYEKKVDVASTVLFGKELGKKKYPYGQLVAEKICAIANKNRMQLGRKVVRSGKWFTTELKLKTENRKKYIVLLDEYVALLQKAIGCEHLQDHKQTFINALTRLFEKEAKKIEKRKKAIDKMSNEKSESLKNKQYITNLHDLILEKIEKVHKTRESVMQIIETYKKPIEMYNIEMIVINDKDGQVIDSQIMEQLDNEPDEIEVDEIEVDEIEVVKGQKKFSEMSEIKKYYNKKLLKEFEVPSISDEEKMLIKWAKKFKSSKKKDLGKKIDGFMDILTNAPDDFYKSKKSSKDKHNYAYHLQNEITGMAGNKKIKFCRTFPSKKLKSKDKFTDKYVALLEKAIGCEHLQDHKQTFINAFTGFFEIDKKRAAAIKKEIDKLEAQRKVSLKYKTYATKLYGGLTVKKYEDLQEIIRMVKTTISQCGTLIHLEEIQLYLEKELYSEFKLEQLDEEEKKLTECAKTFETSKKEKDLKKKIDGFRNILENAPEDFFTAKRNYEDKNECNYAYLLKEEIIDMAKNKKTRNDIRPRFSTFKKQFEKASLTDLYVELLVKAINHEKMEKHKTILIRVFDGILFNDAIQKVNKLYLSSAALEAESNMCARATEREDKKATKKIAKQAPNKRAKANGIVEQMKTIIKSWANPIDSKFGTRSFGGSLVDISLRSTVRANINSRLPDGCQKVSL